MHIVSEWNMEHPRELRKKWDYMLVSRGNAVMLRVRDVEMWRDSVRHKLVHGSRCALLISDITKDDDQCINEQSTLQTIPGEGGQQRFVV